MGVKAKKKKNGKKKICKGLTLAGDVLLQVPVTLWNTTQEVQFEYQIQELEGLSDTVTLHIGL